MIKIKIVKFFLIFALALLSISTCFPNDYDCSEERGSELVVKVVEKTSSSNSEKESHYCICTMTCHTMFMSFTSFEKFTAYLIFNSKKFQHIPQFYPEISYSLEKPPTV